MEETDLAYAAGLIDGEGSIGIYKTKYNRCHYGYHYRLLIQIGMCDAIATTWMYKNFSGNYGWYDRPGVSYQRMHRWQLNDKRASDLLVLLLPYLKTKKVQAEIAIEFQKGKRKSSDYPNNTKPLVLMEADAILAQRISALKRGKKLDTVTAADAG